MPVARTSVCHWLRLMATTITRRPSLRREVAAERAVHVVAERRAVLVRRPAPAPRKPRLATIVNATSASESFTSWPSPVARRWRSAARMPITALRPVAMSHAGSALFTGNSEPTGPVASAMPDAAFTV